MTALSADTTRPVRRSNRARTGLAITCAAALLLAGCGDDDSSPAATPTPASTPVSTSSSPSSTTPAITAPIATGTPVGDAFLALSGDDIEAAASQTTRDLDSARLRFDGRILGDQAHYDVHVTTGSECVGEVTVGGTGTVRILTTGTRRYFRPDRAFWEHTAPGKADRIIAVVAGRWIVELPGSEPLFLYCDLDNHNLGIQQWLGDHAADHYRRGEVSTYEGRRVVEVVPVDPPADLSYSRALVPIDGTHAFARVERPDGEGGTNVFRLSAPDAPVEASEPAPQDVIDFSDLMASA